MALNRKRKLLIIIGILVAVASVIIISVVAGGKDVPVVQTAKVQRQATLESKVTASGVVRPVRFFNLTAEVPGRVERIYVKEGDFVKQGEALVSVDPTQLQLQTQGTEAAVRASEAEANSVSFQVSAAENNVNQVKASLLQARSDLDRLKADLINAEADFRRQTDLLESGVGTRAAFDASRARYDGGRAAVAGGEARVKQLEAAVKDAEIAVDRARSSYNAAVERSKQTRMTLNSQRDQFQKTTKYAPIDGVVSDIQTKEGQFALANFSSTPLMIVNDMSQINVEVKVDETDIKDVRLDQLAKVKVDALGDQEIAGRVVQIAASAITRSGQSIAQTQGSQEAKDFIVKVQLEMNDELRAKLRPGMSATAVITTQTRENILSIPLSAIVQRAPEKNDKNPAGGDREKPKEEQGVYVVKSNKVIFVPIQTGITGETDIEVTSGLSENDEIVKGPFRQLRTLKNDMEVKVDNNEGPKTENK